MRPPTIPTTISTSKEDNRQMTIMKSLYNALIEHREPKSQRIVISPFMCLPSRKEFADYFNIIEKPIAMNKIREKIEKKLYETDKACIDDFKLMFNNCRIFNEDDSQIYRDAVVLEELVLRKYEQFSTTSNSINNNHSPTKATNLASTNVAPTSKLPSNASTNNANNSVSKNSVANTSSPAKITAKSTDAHPPPLLDSKSTTANNHINHHDDSPIKNHHMASALPDELSLDSNSNLSADLLASTPIEKCSLNTRRGKNAEVPKRQLLTGYIIYASEIRKKVIDKHPNQNFGDISRLVGNEWKALPHDIRVKYDERALIHNRRVREKAQRELAAAQAAGVPPPQPLTNGHTPNMTKRKLAKLAKEQMRQHHLSIASLDDSSSAESARLGQELASPLVNKSAHPQTQTKQQVNRVPTSESSTQTNPIRFVEPPTKQRLVYSEAFRKYIESLHAPSADEPMEVDPTADRPQVLPVEVLGAGIGRHESVESALWSLRDFMLQDVETMRRSMEPYL